MNDFIKEDANGFVYCIDKDSTIHKAIELGIETNKLTDLLITQENSFFRFMAEGDLQPYYFFSNKSATAYIKIPETLSYRFENLETEMLFVVKWSQQIFHDKIDFASGLLNKN